MGIASEFKEFAVKGNVVDLAVGVIIGAAFGKIVDSLVGDVVIVRLGRTRYPDAWDHCGFVRDVLASLEDVAN